MMQRPVGVAIPEGQNQMAGGQTRAAPRQLLSIAEMRTFGVQYSDDSGTVRTALCHMMGDKIYMHPADEAWAGSIRQASKWLGDAVYERVSTHDAVIAAQAREPSKAESTSVDVTPPVAKT